MKVLTFTDFNANKRFLNYFKTLKLGSSKPESCMATTHVKTDCFRFCSMKSGYMHDVVILSGCMVF